MVLSIIRLMAYAASSCIVADSTQISAISHGMMDEVKFDVAITRAHPDPLWTSVSCLGGMLPQLGTVSLVYMSSNEAGESQAQLVRSKRRAQISTGIRGSSLDTKTIYVCPISDYGFAETMWDSIL
eukprot:5150032-Pleurochrysis_carterae.AAC.4